MKKISTSTVVSFFFIFQLFLQNPIWASNSPLEIMGSLDEIDTIRTTQNGSLMSAEIDPIPGATTYTWRTGQGAPILSGQGTVNVEIDWGAAELSTICVVASNDSMFSRSKCKNFFSTVDLTPCLPIANGIPARNAPPGCHLCGPIYQGSTAGFFPGLPGNGAFPCGTIENNQFIAIIADASGSTSITILASNCQNNVGVQLIVYDVDFNPVSNCFSSGGTNLPGNVTASGLTPGETYWVMIDGFAGDICDILLTTSGGITNRPPDVPAPMKIEPDTSPLCPGAVVKYSIDPISGASRYTWLIPGNGRIIEGGGTSDKYVLVEYLFPGGGVVRVTPSNPCFPGIPAIEPVVVLPILPTLKPPEFICSQDFPIVRDGNVFSDPGSHEVIYKTALDCDSVVTYVFIPNVQIPEVIDTTICAGECVQIGFDCYDQPISQSITLGPPFAQANGCDSVVILKINLLEPIALIQPTGQLGCNPGDRADLDGTASSSGNGISYEWEAINGGALAGPSNTNFTQATTPGTYILTVTQTNPSGITCVASDSVNVTLRNTGVQLPIFSQAETSVCANSSHTYTVSPVSGALPNGYQWTLPVGAFISQSPDSNSVEVTFGNEPMSGQICVIATSLCDDSPLACIPVTINAIPTSDFTITNPICITDASTINYTGTASPFANFTWNLNGGTSPTSGTGAVSHEVHWDSPGLKTVSLQVEENGCVGARFEKLIQVDAELSELYISCASTESSVSFSWNSIAGADEYNISVNGLSSTVQTGTSFDINGLTQGEIVEITVIANGNTICAPRSATATCIAQNCPAFDLNIDPIASICRDGSTPSIPLSANPTGGAGGGILIWKGNAVTGNFFDPFNAKNGINVVALEYTEGLCTTIETIDILIHDVPDPSFTVAGPICIDELATVTYTGSASVGANFNWDFGGGAIVTGTGAGPYEIDFSGAPGTYTITLTVEENGCISSVASQTIQIDEPLAAPQIRCATSTSTGVTIEWTVEPGITYTVNPPIGTIDMNAGTITVDGLNPGDIVSGEIVAEGTTAYGSSSMTFMCSASDCPPEAVTIDPIGPFCKNGLNQQVALSATAGDNTGTFTFSGPGVIQPDIFDPNSPAINPGIVTVRVVYEKDNCRYSGVLDIEIIKAPTSDFLADGPICIDEIAIVSYTGNAGVNAVFDWQISGNGRIEDFTSNFDQIGIKWPNPGIQEISLVVSENGCQSDTTIRQVQVDEFLTPPVISCDSDRNNINFSWNSSPNVLQYDTEIISSNITNPVGTSTPFAWNFSGLNPGNFIEIEVTALGLTSCGTASSRLLCLAQNCIDYNVVMPQIDTCLYSNISGFDLVPGLFVTNQLGDNLLDSINILWFGPPGTTYLTLGGSFFPSAAATEFGTGDVPISVEIEYPRGSGCFKTFNSTIHLKPVPNNSISTPTAVCFDESATVALTGLVADPNAIFDWNFEDATVLSGAGSGPFEISWDPSFAGTTKTVSLRVTEEGCTSDLITAEIRIDEELENLNLLCDINNSGNQLIGFTWNDIGANDIKIEVINSNVSPLPTATVTTNFSALFDGLTPRDEITLQVTANNTDSPCPAVSATLTCLAKVCPPTIFEIDPIPSFCEGEQLQIQSASTITDDPCNGSGTTTWSGDGVNADGLIDTGSLPPGIYQIVASYICDNCSYRATVQYEIFPKPKLTAEIANPIWAPGTSGNIDLTVSGGIPNYQFAWDNGEIVEDISDAAPGNYCVTVGDQNGCFETDCYVINNGTYRISPIHIMCRGEQENLTVRPGRGADFSWFPSDGLSCTDCPSPIASPSQSTIYTVLATLPNGRIDSTGVLVFVLPPVLCNSRKITEISNQIEELDFTNFDKNDLKEFESHLLSETQNGDSKLDDSFSLETQRRVVQIIPNPTSGLVQILSDFEIEKIEVFDFSGKEILEKNSSKIDLSSFPQGVYILKIKTAEGEFVKRVVLMPH